MTPHQGHLLFQSGNEFPLMPTCYTCGGPKRLRVGRTYFALRERWVKIGFTANADPLVRIRSLRSRPAQVLLPYEMDPGAPLTLLAVVNDDVEHFAHCWYHDEHTVGEWFELDVTALVDELMFAQEMAA